MRTIAIVNQKGGCGKTTTAINLAAVYARRGLRTLLVDMDPQSHCAAGLGVPEERIDFSIFEALRAEAPERVDPARLLWPVARHLALAPSTVRLAAAEAAVGGLAGFPDRDRRLERLLERMAPEFDRCLIDCPPTIGLLTFNALRAARHVLIPVETSYFALKGAQRQWETIGRVVTHLGRPINVMLLPTMHRTADREGGVLSSEVLSALRERFAGNVTPVVIRFDETLRDAASMGQAVVEFAPDSDAAADHERLADWIETCCKRECGNGMPDSGGPIVEVVTARGDAASQPLAAMDRRAEGGRAAELAGRLRSLGVASVIAPTMAPNAEAELEVDAPYAEREMARLKPGVEIEGSIVRFRQPRVSGEVFAIAGDFNGWSERELELKPGGPDDQWVQAEILLPPGRYQYRVVRDGQWQVDPYNGHRVVNAFGEENSAFIVSAADGMNPDSAEPT